jgi:hypothetical protein
MEKIVYAIKICLLDRETTASKSEGLSDIHYHYLQLLVVYMQFCCQCTMEWLETVPHNLLMYDAVDPVVSRSAIRAFQRHLWNLTAEMVSLALFTFSSIVPKEEKRALADRLLAIKPQEVIQ